MSIKLKGSTDGSVTLQAPADTSPTGTDKTFTLPTADGTSGQVLTTNGSGALSFANEGKILQVLQAVKDDALSVSLATLTESSNILSQAITVAASSKVLVSCTLCLSSGTTLNGLSLNRDGTNIGIHESAGNRYRGTATWYKDSDSGIANQTVTVMFLDSPGSAGTYTYGVKVRHGSSATQTVYVNTYADDSDISKRIVGISTLTVMEVAA